MKMSFVGVNLTLIIYEIIVVDLTFGKFLNILPEKWYFHNRFPSGSTFIQYVGFKTDIRVIVQIIFPLPYLFYKKGYLSYEFLGLKI